MNIEKIAFLFPGQGSQVVGMAKDLYDNIEECKEILDNSQEILDMPLKEMMFDGPIEELKQTENAQPALLVSSLMALKALEINGIEAKYTAGLSLGEYGSLVYGNILSMKDALLIVKERGKIMGSALPKGLGKMAAILKLDEEKVEELVKRASEVGIVEGANYNCPGQVVISGENNAIAEAIKIAPELGGKAIELNVSGPFHSSLSKDAGEKFYDSVKDKEVGKPNKVVYSNVKSLPYEENDDIKKILKDHISTPVHFESIIRDMIKNGVETFIEVGQGKTLCGFIRKIDRTVKTLNVQDIDSLNKCIKEIK